MPADPALTAEQEYEDSIEAEVRRRVNEALRLRAEQEKAHGYQSPLAYPDEATGEGGYPAWYPTPAPIEEDDSRRVFPRGTFVHEVLEYDRQETARRLAEKGDGRAPKPLPQGTVTATREEFLYSGR